MRFIIFRYAFIEYKSGTSAHRAATQADKMMVDDREILVDMECERELKGIDPYLPTLFWLPSYPHLQLLISSAQIISLETLLLPGWIPRRLGGGFGGKKESGQLRFGGKDRPFRKPIILKQTGERFHQESHNGKQKSSTDQTLRVRASDDSSCDSKSAHVKFSNKYDRSDKSRSRYTDYEAYKGESSSGRDRSDRSHRKRMHESSRHKDYTRRRSTSREKRKSKKLHRRSRSSSREPKRKK